MSHYSSKQAINVPTKTEHGFRALFDLIFVIEFDLIQTWVKIIGFS